MENNLKEEVKEQEEEKIEPQKKGMKKALFVILALIIFTVSYVFGYVIGNKLEDKQNKDDKKTEETNKNNDGEEINNNDALLWKVESDTATIYLAGSIHVGREQTYPLQQKLLDAFDDSDVLAVEIDLMEVQSDVELQVKSLQYAMYPEGASLADDVSEETLTLLNDYVQQNGINGTKFTTEELYQFKAWYIQNSISTDFIELAELDANLGIDMYFLSEAKDRGMDIIEVENAEFQFQMFDSFSKELDEYLLKSVISTTPEMQAGSLKLYMDAWETGNITEFIVLSGLNEPAADEETKKLMAEYNEKLIINRNITMTDKVEELLKGNKNVFYIVGGAHMIGDSGIVKLLEERGYTVTKL